MRTSSVAINLNADRWYTDCECRSSVETESGSGSGSGSGKRGDGGGVPAVAKRKTRSSHVLQSTPAALPPAVAGGRFLTWSTVSARARSRCGMQAHLGCSVGISSPIKKRPSFLTQFNALSIISKTASIRVGFFPFFLNSTRKIRSSSI